MRDGNLVSNYPNESLQNGRVGSCRSFAGSGQGEYGVVLECLLHSEIGKNNRNNVPPRRMRRFWDGNGGAVLGRHVIAGLDL